MVQLLWSNERIYIYGRPLNHLLTHVILVRVACGSNIRTLEPLCSAIDVM